MIAPRETRRRRRCHLGRLRGDAVELVRDVIHLEYRKQAWNDRTAVYLPILGVSSDVLTATAFFKNRQTTTSVEDQALASQRLWTLVQLTGFSLLFFFKGWMRPSAAHMALAIVPSLAIITVYRGIGAAMIVAEVEPIGRFVGSSVSGSRAPATDEPGFNQVGHYAITGDDDGNRRPVSWRQRHKAEHRA